MILTRCEAGDWEWIGSEVVDLEINQTPDPERRRRVGLLASHTHRSVVVSNSEIERAQQFEVWGISAFDALHLACAESGGSVVQSRRQVESWESELRCTPPLLLVKA